MVKRTYDALAVNAILNHPGVFPFISVPGIENIDAAAIIADEHNIALMANGGCFILIFHEPGVYEIHTNFLPEARGRNAIRAAEGSVQWMFLNTDCMSIVTQVPEANRAARWLCAKSGFELEFERKAVWPTSDGLSDLSYWALRYDGWIKRSLRMMETGKFFLEKLDEEFVRLQLDIRSSLEDCYCLHVGALFAMALCKQFEKGIALYNRWARFSGYGRASLISRAPILIDLSGVIVQLTDDWNLKVIKCR